MLFMICAGYFCGIWIETRKNHKAKKAVTALSVTFCLVILGYFKYMDFVLDTVNRMTGLSFTLLHIALPIGISFYTFQILSYLLDIYYEKIKAQRNILTLATYIAMFPQLIAGPIVRYQDIEIQLQKRTVSVSNISCGIRRFIIGLGKKVIFANTLGEIGAKYGAAEEKTVLFVWFYAIAVTLQTYFDFSGYSDMAIGLGKMLGFDFPENFEHPLDAKSVTQFWRRWHMTLGRFFRDYLYIPMGGNRVSFVKWVRNILIVWMATGLWHGADWTFVVWGLFFAFFLVLEKTFLKQYLEKAHVWNRLYLWILLTVSFVIFHASGLSDAAQTIQYMTGLGGIPFLSAESLFYFKDYFLLLLLGSIGATSFPLRFVTHLKQNAGGRKVVNILEPLFLITCLMISVSFLINGSFNPFLYFRF
ncbi:MAG: MBOAT family O-acyltransferase [Lachnospiraceae bacterium]